MKITYLAQQSPELRQPPFDGPANHMRYVARELQALGHSVNVAAGIDQQVWLSAEGQPFRAFQGRGAVPAVLERLLRRLQTSVRFPYLNYFESRRFAAGLTRTFPQTQALLERASWTSYGGALAARWLGVPWVLEYNGDPLHDLSAKGMAPQGLQRQISTEIMRSTLHSADHLIASGQGWKRNLIETWQVPEQRITVIENGTPLVDLLTRGQLRNFEPGAAAKIEIVYLGGFDAWQGTQQALLAFKRLLATHIPAHLVMIGAGVTLAESQALADRLGLEGAVTFTGALSPEAYAPYLAAAEIGLSPYCGWKEFSGLKLFDYKAAGLAIIASGEGDQPLTLTHGETGWIVPPCDEEALGAALIHLAADRDLRRRLGQNARLEAEQQHSWRHTAQAIAALLTDLSHAY